MDNFYIKLENGQLPGAVQQYKDKVSKIADTQEGNTYHGLMGIKNFTKNINLQGNWSGRLYNNVVKQWNEVTSPKLYNEMNAYYTRTVGALQNIADIYSGLEIPSSGIDVGGNAQLTDETYVGLNEKLPLTDEMEVTFVLANISLFQSTVEHIGETIVSNTIAEIDAYLDENFKGKSTTLDLYVQKIKELNVAFNSRIKDIVQEYYNVIEKNVEVLKQMEDMSMKDVNEKL